MMKNNDRYTKGLRWAYKLALCSILLVGLNPLLAQPVQVGDLITFPDGSKGIVCHVDPDNDQKGWVADLNDMPGIYKLYPFSPVPSTPAMSNRSPNSPSLSSWTPEGYANTSALYQMNDGTYFSPAAEAVNPESGWYIPDAQQMVQLVGMVPLLQPAFAKAGGNITNLVQYRRNYWTSSRSSTSSFYYLYNNSTTQGGNLTTSSPSSSYYIRRVRDFNMASDLQAYWKNEENGTGDPTARFRATTDTTYTGLVIYGVDTFEVRQPVFVYPVFNKDTVYGDTVYIGIPYDMVLHNVTFHVTGPGNDTIYDTLKTVNGCDSIQTVILRITQPKELFYYDTVCQSQVNSYDSLYPAVAFAVFGESAVDSLVRASGELVKEKVYLKDATGKDSTVNFHLVVIPHPVYETSIVTTSLSDSVRWYDSVYTVSGTHTVYTQQTDGCDYLDILHLVILEIDTTADTTCANTPIGLYLPVTINGVPLELFNQTPLLASSNKRPRLGYVLCTDGSVLHPDTYLLSDKTAMGVVLSVDEEAGYGRAIALSNAYSTHLRWAYTYESRIHSTPKTTPTEAVQDMDGANNTNEIWRTVMTSPAGADPDYYAPAAYYCKFYNHNTYTLGTDSLGWYLPAAGEMQLIYGNRVELNKTLSQLRTQDIRNTLLYNGYWTSTEYNNSYVWSLNSSGRLTYSNKIQLFYARPVIQFPLP